MAVNELTDCSIAHIMWERNLWVHLWPMEKSICFSVHHYLDFESQKKGKRLKKNEMAEKLNLFKMFFNLRKNHLGENAKYIRFRIIISCD